MAPTSRFNTRWLAAGLLSLMLLAGAAFAIAYFAATSFLGSDTARLTAQLELGKVLRAQVQVSPMRWDSSSLHLDSIEARGHDNSPVRSLTLQQIRVEPDLSSLWTRRFRASSVEMAQVSLDIKAPSTDPVMDDASSPATPPLSQPTKKHDQPTTTPPADRVSASAVDVSWPMGGNRRGSIQGMGVQAHPEGKDWLLNGKGGKLDLPGFPKLGISTLAARIKPSTLIISQSKLGAGGSGAVSFTGAIDLQEHPGAIDAQVALDKLDIQPLLGEDWKARLFGLADGVIFIKTEQGSPVAQGKVQILEARVEALPALEKAAKLTGMDSLRKIQFHQAQGDVLWRDGILTVENILLDSRGLMQSTGSYQQAGEEMRGEFQLGVTPQVVAALPGAKDTVFTEERDGLLWTAVHLKGTKSKPEEDLTPRLFSAAITSVIQAIPGDVKETIEQGAKGVWDVLDRVLRK